jgi:hypothetical protein
MTHIETSQVDEIMAEVGRAVELGRAGERAPARAALTALWERAGDALHRCTIAHYLADLQDDVAEELRWDQRALAAVAGEEQVGEFQVRQLLPSLHLNLADAHRRLGDADPARRHLAVARDLVGELPDDEYGVLIRTGVEHVTGALAAGSRERLVTP